jgi:hypothetical protein
LVELFERAKSPEQFSLADQTWTELKPALVKFETKLKCEESGARGDEEMIKSTVNDLVKGPVGLCYDVAKFIYYTLSDDYKEEKEVLQSILKDLKDLAKDKGKEKAEEKAKDIGKKLVEKFFHNPGPSVLERLKECLLRILQKNSRRSRQYFLKILDDITHIGKGYGGMALKVIEASRPSKISPEYCGINEWVEDARKKALTRVFDTSKEALSTSGPLIRRP